MGSKIRLGSDEIKFMTLFESLTGATVLDCVVEDNALGFLVKKGDMGRAIGKKGSNIEKVRNTVGKSVIVVESDENKREFIKKMFEPVKIHTMQFKENGGGNNVVIEVNKQDRRKVIGSEGSRIKVAMQFARRHHMIDDISVQII
ncbi:MAG: NusA-like transcription termination signal-binding factor [Candidatus Altiarchaeota archaeon]